MRKNTVTESVRRSLAALRPAFDYLHYLAATAELGPLEYLLVASVRSVTGMAL